MFNLIEEKWIPVICESGKSRYIAPWEIADADDMPVRVNHPMADVDSVLTQFLIGLYQTVCIPESSDDWLELLESPPNTESIKK